MPAEKFAVTTKLELNSKKIGEKAGLLAFGMDYSYIAIEKARRGYRINQVICADAIEGKAEEPGVYIDVPSNEVYFKVEIKPENEKEIVPRVICNFSYSLDGKTFQLIGKPFVAREGLWVGAKVGLFSVVPSGLKDSGYVDCDWFRISKL